LDLFPCENSGLGFFDSLRERHPHVSGIELLPYDAGDEATFCAISEADREEVATLFQQAARSRGNLYTAAELRHCEQEMVERQAAYKRVA